MMYMMNLVEAAGRGSSPAQLDDEQRALVAAARDLLNLQLQDAFRVLSQAIPQLADLEAEVRRSQGELDDRIRRSWWRQGVRDSLTARIDPKALFFIALGKRLAPLVGTNAPDSVGALGKTLIAYGIAWGHLGTLAGYPPERS